MAQNTQVNQSDDRVSIRDMILTFKSYRIEIWKNKLLVLLFIIATGVLLFTWSYTRPVTYTAKTTFMLSEDSGGASPLESVLGSFGIGGGDYNLLKLMELCRSRRISEKVLFTKATIKGKEDWIANHIIREQNLQKTWNKKIKELKNFYFTRDSLDKFSRTENKALQQVHVAIVGNPKAGTVGIMETEVSEETGILSLTMNARNEELSIILARNVFDALSAFYTSKSVQQEQETFDLMRHKRDSLYKALTGTDYALARFNDANANVIRQTPMVPSGQMIRQSGILAGAYAEALKNTELAEFSLSISKPFVQAIDLPVPPLTKVTPSPVKLTLYSVLTGLLLGTVFIGFRKFYRDAMQLAEETESPAAT